MKLNPDCIRAVMLEIEHSWTINLSENNEVTMGIISLNELSEALPDFSKQDIFYTLFNLDQAGYLSIETGTNIMGEITLCIVKHMTFAGHEFLNQIRDSKNWSKVRKGLDAIRNYSLNAITAVSEGITSAAITAAVKELGS